MTPASNTPCPTDETLAQFASGNIDDPTRNDVLAHIETCSECMAAVLSANAYLEEERSAHRGWAESRWWMSAVAAAIVIAIISFPLFRGHNDPIARLVALAPVSGRQVEPRLSGGFAWAPYHGPMRATNAATDTAGLKLGGAAGDAIERAQRDHSEEAQRAAAVALVLIDRPSDAINRLQTIAAQSPGDARAWNDLAAARYAGATQIQRPSLLPEALAAADRALTADPKSAEALFNRALILERMSRAPDAQKAWLRYLEVDSTSPWATEARAHLREVTPESN